MQPNRILLGNCVDLMAQLPDDSIPCIITSPPYDDIRDFGGHRWDFEVFQNVAAQMWRILEPGGNICWIVQDRIREGISGTKYRQAIFFQELGFDIHQELHLVTQGHRKRGNRYPNQVQMCFVLSKGSAKYVHILRDRRNVTEGSRHTLFHRNKDGSTKTYSGGPRTPRWGYRTNVWRFSAVDGNDRRRVEGLKDFPALMQEKMAEDLIISFSRPGEVVLDPFCGGGTVPKMALMNHRFYLGFEVWPWAHEVATRRLQLAHSDYLAAHHAAG